MHRPFMELASVKPPKEAITTTDASAIYRACIGGVPHKMQKWSNLRHEKLVL